MTDKVSLQGDAPTQQTIILDHDEAYHLYQCLHTLLFVPQLGHTREVCGAIKGSIHLLNAEIQAFYTESDKELQDQCRRGQNLAAELVYRGKVEDNGTFIMFNLYAVHHERAKMLTRFALFHTNDKEQLERLKDTHVQAHSELLEEAHSELTKARKHIGIRQTSAMEVSITVEEIYNLIKSYESGTTLDAVAKQYPPQDPTVPYSVAQLLTDGKIKTEMRREKLYCVALETDIKEREPRKGRIFHANTCE